MKSSALALLATAVALTWSQTGGAQSGPCLVERGIDPLDILNSGVRHNVWIVLDASGSMNDRVSGSKTKMQVAKEELNIVIDRLVDASGKPLVNWGFVRFGSNGVNNTSACNAQFTNNCVGLNLNGLISPPACGGPSNTTAIKNAINSTNASGSTPNGISMDQISDAIVANGFVSGLLENQKNFVILVSDGDDTCECGLPTTNINGKLENGLWTPTLVPPFSSTDAVPRMLRGGEADSGYTQSVGTASTDGPNIRAINAGSKGRLLYERLNPTAADRAMGAKGGAFVIGLGLNGDSPKRAHHMAWEASGAFYGNPDAYRALLADPKNPGSLADALYDAFARIGVPPTRVTLGSATAGTVKEAVPDFTNTALVADDLLGDVGPSQVDPEDVREARENRSNHQDNVLFSSSVEVPGFKGHFTAHNIYEVTDPANPRTARTADFEPIWDAGTNLQGVDPDNRNILFNKRGETMLLPFDISNVTTSDLWVPANYLKEIDGIGAKTTEDAVRMVVNVIRGYRLSKDPITGTLYRPDGEINFSKVEENGTDTWKLYDAIAAPAVVSAPPRSPDFDPPQNHSEKYGVGGTAVGEGFYWAHFNRRTMVYLPTNGGMLHGFDGQTGNELFAYVPDDVMGFATGEVVGSRDTLADFVALVVAENNGIPNHKYLMSGSPSVRDVFLRSDVSGGDDQWHTLLAFGRGPGGRFMSTLDVTDPFAPKLRFNIGNREGLNDGDLDGLGETWSTPVMGNVQTANTSSDPDRADQWLAFFGAGYGCNNTLKEGHYVFAVRLENGSVYYRGQVTNDTTAAIPYNAVVAMPTLYNPHEADVADNKDYVTRAYFGDIQGNIWKLVTLSPESNSWTLRKFAEVGNGQPITAALALLKDVNNQTVYVMGGSGGDLRVSAANLFSFFTYVDRDTEGGNNTQYPLGAAPFWSKALLPAERTYTPPVTIGRVGDAVMPLVFFAASAPGFDTATCTGKFTSSLYALGILSGQPEVDLGASRKTDRIDLGETKITGLYAREGNLYVSKSGSLQSPGGLDFYGDGDFSDDIQTGGSGMTIQVLVDGFRISPF